MNPRIFEVEKILKQALSLYDNTFPDDLPGLLWSSYSSFIPVDDPCTKELEPILKRLSHKRSIVLLRIIRELRDQHEKETFCAGVRVGAQLVFELME